MTVTVLESFQHLNPHTQTSLPSIEGRGAPSTERPSAPRSSSDGRSSCRRVCNGLFLAPDMEGNRECSPRCPTSCRGDAERVDGLPSERACLTCKQIWSRSAAPCALWSRSRTPADARGRISEKRFGQSIAPPRTGREDCRQVCPAGCGTCFGKRCRRAECPDWQYLPAKRHPISSASSLIPRSTGSSSPSETRGARVERLSDTGSPERLDEDALCHASVGHCGCVAELLGSD